MRRLLLLSAAAVTLLAAAGPCAATVKQEWVLDGTKGGVTVYTADVDGSEVKMIKAVTIVEATTDAVWSYLNSGRSLDPVVKVNKEIGTCGEGCAYYYQRIGHPLIQDRHYVIKVQWKVTGKEGQKTYKRWWVQSSDKSPPGKGAILVTKVSGSWLLAPLKDGAKTRLVYTNHLELGGLVPAAFQNSGAVSNAYKLLKKIRSEAGK